MNAKLDKAGGENMRRVACVIVTLVLSVVYVGAQNSDGIDGLDLTLDYDASKLSIVSVQAVDSDSGFSAISNDQGGSLQIAFYGMQPLSGSGRAGSVSMSQAM